MGPGIVEDPEGLLGPSHPMKLGSVQDFMSVPKNLQLAHMEPPLGTGIPARCPGG